MEEDGGDGGEEKWRNQRKWLTRTRTIPSVSLKGLHRGQPKAGLPHERMKTGSVSLTMGKWRRLPM